MSRKVNWNKIARPESGYGKAIAWMRSKKSFTRPGLFKFLRSIGKAVKAATASTTVLISPTEKSNRGDCRGNRSNPFGHEAYVERISRRMIGGRKEVQRLRMRIRPVAMEPRKKNEENAIASQKKATSKTKKRATTKTS